MKYSYLIISIVLVNTAFSANPTYDATKGALQNDQMLCQYGYNPIVRKHISSHNK